LGRAFSKATRFAVLASFVAFTACARVDEPTTPKSAESASTAIAFSPTLANFGGESVPGAVPSPAGLVACFAAENNPLDVVSNTLGALAGGTGFALGKFGQAFNFTALNDGVIIANTPALNFGATGSGITMSAWVYGRGTMFQPSSGIAGAGPIIEYDQGAHLWQHNQQGNAFGIFTNLAEGAASNQWHILQIQDAVPLNGWHHTAVTYSKSTGLITLYVDGSQVGTSFQGVFSPNTTTTLHIGQRVLPVIGEPTFTFNGAIDEVQLYNRGLSASEIGTLAAASGTMCVPPPASYQVATMPISSGESGVPFTTQPTIVILDANNNIVSNATTAVTATVTSGTGTLLGTTTVNAVNGVATFTNLAIAGGGNTTIGFTAAGSLPAEPGFPTVSTALATLQVPRQLAVVTQPVGALSGSVLATQPIVEVRDAAGLRVPTATNAVTASIGSGLGILSGTTTISATAGTAAFSGLIITTPGVSTLSFSSPGLTGATSNPISITGLAASKLAVLTQPGNGESGYPLTAQPSIEVQDANGNRATLATGNVTAQVFSGTGALVGTVQAPIVLGVATFTNLQVNGFGSYTLRFTSGALTGVNSSSFSVIQKVRQLGIIGGPAVVTSGVVMSPPWLIEIRDGAGLRIATATHLVRAGYSGSIGTTSPLLGTYEKNAVAGVVTYDDLITNGNGSFTMAFWVIDASDPYAAYIISSNVALVANNSGGGGNNGNLVAALLRKGPKLNAGDVEGSLQILTADDVSLNGQAKISDKLYIPGMPTVKATGNSAIATTTDGTGSATPTNHEIKLTGQSTIATLVRRTNAAAMPTVAAPAAPAGTRNVSVNSPLDAIGSWSTVKNLTVNGLAGAVAIPAGTYGDIAVSGTNAIVLGTVGATTPTVYNFQSLKVTGNASIQLVGPVVITTAGDVSIDGIAGSALNAAWLTVKIHNGDFTLHGGATAHAIVIAPTGKVTINGNSVLTGGIAADELKLDGNNSKLKITKAIPTP
jgi:hypothetical protein